MMYGDKLPKKKKRAARKAAKEAKRAIRRGKTAPKAKLPEGAGSWDEVKALHAKKPGVARATVIKKGDDGVFRPKKDN